MLEYIAAYFTVTMIIGYFTCFVIGDSGFAFCNPVYIYKKTKVNWFGAIILAVIANVSMGVWAVGYWIYKLCTVGRR